MNKSYISFIVKKINIFIVLSICITASAWFIGDYGAFRTEIHGLEKEYLEKRNAALVSHVDRAIDDIKYLQRVEDDHFKDALKTRVDQAYTITLNLYNKNKGKLSMERIKQLIADTLSSVSWDGGRGYYFVLGMNGSMVVHPGKLFQKNIMDLKDNDGTFFGREMVEIAETKGSGFISYTWNAPTEPDYFMPKISFIRMVEPLNWIIGTGDYTEYIQRDTKKQVLDRLGTASFEGNEGCLIVFDSQGAKLVDSCLKNNGGMWTGALEEPGVMEYHNELMEASRKKGGDFVESTWKDQQTGTLTSRVAYSKSVPEWNWCVTSVLKVGGVEDLVDARVVELKKNFVFKGVAAFMILSLFLFLSNLASKRIAALVMKDFIAFTSFFSSAASAEERIDIKSLEFSEFKDLAVSANKMMEHRKKAEQKVRWHTENLESVVEDRTDRLKKTNIELVREVDDRKHAELVNRTLFHISNSVSESFSLNELYISIHKSLKNIIDVTNFFIALYEKKTNSISFPYFIDEKDDFQSLVTDFSESNSLTGEVIMKGIPVLLDREDLLQRVSENRLLGSAPQVWMGAPLKIKGEIIGVMGTESYNDPNLFSEADLDIFSFVSDQVAIAIDGKRSQEDRSRMMTAMENAAEAFIVITPSGRVEYVNRAFEMFTGFSKAESLTHNINDFLMYDEYGISKKDVLDAVTSRGVWKGRLAYKGHGGRVFRAEVTVSPINDSSGTLINMVAVARDVAREDQLETQLRRAQKMESVGTLAGGIAHDFNNILSAIMGYTQIASIHLERDSKASTSLEKVLQASDRARALIQQILSFSRQTEKKITPMKITPIVKEAVRLIRASIPTSIEIKLDLGPGDDTVNADPTQIHQILMNLCTNAQHAMQDMGGGVLALSLEAVKMDRIQVENIPNMVPGPFLKLSVRDTGRGMSNEIIEKIFDPYFTTKAKEQGTGLGLSVVHGIVKNFGGSIVVESEEGCGSMFNIYLPRIEDEAPVHRENMAKKADGTGERILFVDDEASLVEIGVEILEYIGYGVEAVTDSLEALDLFRKDPQGFDIVITDMTMPNMSGDRLAEELIKIRPDIPILLCTGFSHSIDPKKAAALGIRGYLKKPLTLADLAVTVRRVLDGKLAMDL